MEEAEQTRKMLLLPDAHFIHLVDVTTPQPDPGDDLIEVLDQTLDVEKLMNAVRHPGAGAIATFSGTTRDTFENRQVVQLEYEAYVPMARRQLRAICQVARSRWSLISMAVAHRIGVVPIGEESVFVAVSSVHRKDALEACHYVIDEIKASAPIWKREVYVDGEVWKENAEFFCRNLDGGEGDDVGNEEKEAFEGIESGRVSNACGKEDKVLENAQ